MKLDETMQRYHRLRNGVLSLIFWNIIVMDIALIWRAFNG
jgi:hypothetical protein